MDRATCNVLRRGFEARTEEMAPIFRLLWMVLFRAKMENNKRDLLGSYLDLLGLRKILLERPVDPSNAKVCALDFFLSSRSYIPGHDQPKE